MTRHAPFDPHSEEGPDPRAHVAPRSGAALAEPVTHPLVGIARDLQTRMLSQLRDEHGHVGLRPSLGPFLSLIWVEARPLALLALQLGISKQAVGQLARLAEQLGYIERAATGDEGRRRAIRLSGRGRALVADASGILLEAQREYASRVGEARLRRFASACTTLYVALGVQPRIDVRPGAAADPALGVLPQMAIEIQRRLILATSARGHPGLRASQSQVLPLVAASGTRARDLAQRQRVSRQAISLVCRELESLGYLKRAPDPGDRRGPVLLLTARGERVLADALAASRALEDEFAGILGRTRFDAFCATAAAIYAPIRADTVPGELRPPAIPRLDVILGRGRGIPRGQGREGADREARELGVLATRLRTQLGPEGAAALAALLVGDAPPRARLRAGDRATSAAKRSSR